jgi:hypothetical protein
MNITDLISVNLSAHTEGFTAEQRTISQRSQTAAAMVLPPFLGFPDDVNSTDCKRCEGASLQVAGTSKVDNHSQQTALIWSIANLLRGNFRASDFGKVVLPFTVLRRLDCVLEPSKAAVLSAASAIPSAADEAMREAILNRAAKQSFHNASKFTFALLVADPANIADNVRAYLNGFSPAVRDIFVSRFDLNALIARLDAANLLYLIVKRFADVDLHPDRVSNWSWSCPGLVDTL